MELTLTSAEVALLTRRDRPKAQARVLIALGIPFRIHPVDRALVVSRTAAEAALGSNVRAVPTDNPRCWEVDEEAIQDHGKTSTSR